MSVDVTSNIADEEGNKTSSKVNLDTILVDEIGQFGKYQFRVVLILAVAVIFNSWAASEYVFTTARINTRCLIPECDAEQPEFSPSWVSNAIPESSGGLDNCQRYKNTTQVTLGDSCPASLFDQTELLPCESYVYENTNTVVYDFDLGCDEWRRSMIGTIRTVASFISMPVTGFVSDRWGRRVALTIIAINTAWLGAVRYFANTFIGFVISQFIETAVGSDVISSAFIIMMEITGPKYRVAAGCTTSIFFSTGQMLMGLIAWGVPNWRMFTLTLYLPMFTCIAYIWILNESVRWYMSKGKYDESEALLQKIAKTNGRTLSPKSLAALRRNNEEEKKKKDLERTQNNDNTPWLIVLVFRHKTMILRCIVTPVWWITTMLIFFGLSINAVNISGNRYMNYIAVAAVDIPGLIFAVYMMGKVGRKPVLITALWLCSACMIAYIFLPDGYYGLSLTFYLIGKSSIACVGSTVYVYASELYPTIYRHTFISYSSMMGRVGSVIAPLTPAMGVAIFEKFPFILFASFAFLSGLLTFLVPETLGVTLPDTMEEAVNLGKKEKSSV